VAFHDIATSRAQIDSMIEALDAVFLEGRVFGDLLDAAPGAGSRDVVAKEEPFPRLCVDAAKDGVGFITARVVRNLRRRYVFYAAPLPVLLWGQPLAAHTRELLHRLQNVASLTKERLLADFPRNDVRSCLSMFDRRLVKRAFGHLPDVEMRRFLLRGVRQLAGMLACEEQAAILQYNGVVPYMLREMVEGQPLAAKTNQQAWATLLDDECFDAAQPRGLRAASGALRKLIRFYISIEDGECSVERDLGEFRNQLLEHRTNNMAFHDDCLMLRLCGPRMAEEFDAASGATGQLSDFTRERASLWREFYGRRRGHFNPKATEAAKLKRRRVSGRFSSIANSALSAARLAVGVETRSLSRGRSALA